MGVELNHIIIPAKDKRASAEFLAAILVSCIENRVSKGRWMV